MFRHRSASEMKAHISPTMKAHLIRGAFYLLLLPGVCAISFAMTQRELAALSPTQNPTEGACASGWSAGPDMPSTGVRMVGVSANGKFYVVGGRSMDGVGNDFTHPFEYDPGSNSWTIKSATFPDNQVSNMACGVLTDNGTPYIYCVGGSAGGQTTATARVFRYNPVTDVIESIASPWPGNSDGITLPGGFAVLNNKLYILGGFRINTAMTNQIWEFTPTTNIWMLKNAVLPVARGYIPARAIYSFSNGYRIYTGGGSDWNGTTLVDTNDSFSYDPIADSITTILNIPRATGETAAVIWQFPKSDQQMLVMGGGRTPPNPSNEINVYLPDTNSWGGYGHFQTARRNFAVDSNGGCGFSSGGIWLVGGYASDGTPLSSMEIYCEPCFQGTPTATPTATRTPTPTATATATAIPCHVTNMEPVCGSVVTGTAPTDFIVSLSDPVDPTTVQGSDFTVNGTVGNAFALLNGNMTIVFHFNTTPVMQGLNTMHIPAGAFNCGNGPVAEFTCTFTYQASTPTATPTATLPPPTPTATPTASATPTATVPSSPTPTVTPGVTPTPSDFGGTPTSTPTATATATRVTPTPRPHPSPAPRP